MRAAATIASLVGLSAITATAIPTEYGHGHYGGYPHQHCLKEHDAHRLVYEFVSLFEEPNADLARKILTVDYENYSDSTNSATPNGPPLGAPIVTSRKDAIAQGEANGPSEKFTVFDYFYSCDKITFRWKLNTSPNVVRGIDALYTVYKNGHWKIKTDYSEFNNVALLANFGLCPGGPCTDPAE